MPVLSRSDRRISRTLRTARILLLVSLLMLSPVGPDATRRVSAQAGVPAPPQIVGEMAAVFDANTGKLLYGKDEHKRNAMASTTKIMVGVLTVEKLPLDTIVTVSADDLVGEASMGLRAGEQISVHDLLYGLMMVSGNDAAMALAREVGSREQGPDAVGPVDRFVALMNQKAQELGMKDTHYANPHGLDSPDHYSSAYDLGILTRYAMSKPILTEIAATKEAQVGERPLTNVNKLLESYNGADGFKTGLTDNAGYCLVGTATRGNQKVISVVLKSTYENWFQDSGLLLDYGFTLLSLPTPTPTAAPTPIPSPTSAPAPAIATAAPGSSSNSRVVTEETGKPAQSWWSWALIIAGAVGVGFVGLQARRFLLIHIELPRPHRRVRIAPREMSELDSLDGVEEGEAFTALKSRGIEDQPAPAASPDPRQGPRYMVREVPPAKESPRWHRWSVRPDQPRSQAAGHDQPEPRLESHQDSVPAIFRREREQGVDTQATEPAPAADASGRKSSPQVIDTAARAVSLALGKRYDEAKAEFCKVIRSDPSFDFRSVPAFRQMDATGYAAMILSYHQCGYPVHARALLTVALLRYPDNYHLLLAGDLLARDKGEA